MPHEHRRELRGARVFAAWLNHDDSRGINSLDLLETAGDRRYVKHYMFDFGSILGSGTATPSATAPATRYILEWKPGWLTLATLGLYTRPWMHIDYPDDTPPAIGRLEATAFDPVRWKPSTRTRRYRRTQSARLTPALAISASPTTPIANPSSTGAASAFGAIARGVYDLDATQLPPCLRRTTRLGPWVHVWSNVHHSDRRFGNGAGAQEAAASGLQGASLCGTWNREHEVPGPFGAGSSAWRTEDGLFQAREILALRFAADLVTLSACDTGSGTVMARRELRASFDRSLQPVRGPW